MNRRSFLRAAALVPVAMVASAAVAFKRDAAFSESVGLAEIRRVFPDGSLGPNLLDASKSFDTADWTYGDGWTVSQNQCTLFA